MKTGGQIIAIATAACGFAATAAQAQERIQVTGYTGVWFEAQKTCIIEPFNKATKDVVAIIEPALSSTTFVKLKQQKDRPEIDVAWIDGGTSEQAAASGLVDTIDPAIVTNVAGMVDQGVYKGSDGKIFSLSTGFYAEGILYNSKETKQKPTSWWDLWEPAYAGRVIFPSPAQAPFVPTFMLLNKLLGGTSSNYDPAIEKFRALKVSTFYDTTGIVQTAVQAGDVVIGAYYVNVTWAITDLGLPIAAAVPKEGLPAGDIRIHLVKGTKHKAAAEKFINFAVSADALNCLSEKLYLGPPLKSPKVSDAVRQRLPWGAEGSIANLVIPDWNEVNAKKPQIIEMWNRKVLNK